MYCFQCLFDINMIKKTPKGLRVILIRIKCTLYKLHKVYWLHFINFINNKLFSKT